MLGSLCRGIILFTGTLIAASSVTAQTARTAFALYGGTEELSLARARLLTYSYETPRIVTPHVQTVLVRVPVINQPYLVIDSPWVLSIHHLREDGRSPAQNHGGVHVLDMSKHGAGQNEIYLEMHGIFFLNPLYIEALTWKETQQRFTRRFAFFGFFFAVLLFVVFNTVTLYIALRDNINLYFAAYVVPAAIYFFFRNGLWNQGFFQQGISPEDLLRAVFLVANVAVMGIYLFSERFLHFKHFLVPRILGWIFFVGTLIYPIILFSFFDLSRIWLVANGLGLMALVVFTAGVLAWKKHKNARTFLEALVWLFVLNAVHQFMLLAFLPQKIWMDYLPQIGFLAAVIRISYGLNQRIKDINEQRMQAEAMTIETLRNRHTEHRLLLATAEQISVARQAVVAARAAAQSIIQFTGNSAARFHAFYVPIMKPSQEEPHFFHFYDPEQNTPAHGSISTEILTNLIASNPEFLPVRGKNLEGVLHIRGLHLEDDHKHYIQTILKYLLFKLENLRQSSQEKLAIVGSLASGIVHDIRNNAYAIKTLSSLLYHSDQNLELRNALNETIDRITGLSEDILDYARGKIRIEPRVIWMDTYMEKVRALLEPILSVKSVRLLIRLDYKGPVEMDATRFQRVIYNLATNAADAMSQGGVFSIFVWDADSRLFLQFIDTGPGIEEDIQPMIFEPFFSSGKVRGTGIGLAVVHSIVEAHHGKIFFETQIGKGTVFTISLPLTPGSAVLPS
ncbi:MAG: sensor histidine kinase [Spirochaetales bacterium]|nr:sensor histidine kinase [Spirochaetales bacterium]